MPRLYHKGAIINKIVNGPRLITKLYHEGRIAYEARGVDKIKDAPKFIEIIREFSFEPIPPIPPEPRPAFVEIIREFSFEG